ncbi:MAG: TonB family protein [Acidobacteriota bacterium]
MIRKFLEVPEFAPTIRNDNAGNSTGDLQSTFAFFQPFRVLAFSALSHAIGLSLLLIVHFTSSVVPSVATSRPPLLVSVSAPHRLTSTIPRALHPAPTLQRQNTGNTTPPMPVYRTFSVPQQQRVSPANPIPIEFPALVPIVQIPVVGMPPIPALPTNLIPLPIILGGLTNTQFAASVKPTGPIRNSAFSSQDSAEGTPTARTAPHIGGFGETETGVRTKPPVELHASGFSSTGPPTTSIHASTVQEGGFRQTTVTVPSPTASSKGPQSLDSSIEILSKPKPEYTEEARKLRVEGTVVVEVLFLASGHARGLRVVSGLGHGLDEAAIVAVEGIRYHAATKTGIPVDSNATVRIVFQLAY